MLPLNGYRILACENGLAGPICSRQLADLGAEVVKIERPGSGDVTRGWDTGAAGLATGFVWVDGDWPELGPVPGLGEHTREVLAEAGLSAAEIDELL